MLLAAAVAVAPRPAVAQSRTSVRLVYERGGDVPGCPAEATLRDGVVRRLGYDPFADDAPRSVIARVVREGGELRARVELRASSGEVLGERELASTRGDCGELTAAVELAIAIAVDPVAAVGGPGPTPPGRRAGPLRAFLAARALGAFGVVPGPTGGATLAGGIRRAWGSLALELSGAAPGETAAGPGRVSAWPLLVALVPCGHYRWLAGCLVAAGGVLRASGQDLAAGRQATIPQLELGGRLALEVPVAGPFFASLHADLLVPVLRARLEVSDRAVWRSGPIAGVVGGGVGVWLR